MGVNELSSIMFSLLRFEISKTEVCDEQKNLITPEILLALYKLSKKHDLAHLICDALDKNGLLFDGEAKNSFLKERFMAVCRYERQQYEVEQICSTLGNAKIPFMPLKGSVIRNYYPEPWMRTSCDIDILVKKEELEKASQVLCDELGYSKDAKVNANELTLYSPSGIHLELHYDLTEGDRYGKDILSNIWDYATVKEENSLHFILQDSAFYFYHIAHMVKHFESGGFGVRPILDLWILNNKVAYDKEARNKLLDTCSFLKFASACEELSNIWFSCKVKEENIELLENYILFGGVYGNEKNRVDIQQTQKGSKGKYLLSRIFMPYSLLKFRYPILKNHKWLYPFMIVVRWFGVLFNGDSKRIKNEIKLSESVSEEKKNDYKKLLDYVGL